LRLAWQAKPKSGRPRFQTAAGEPPIADDDSLTASQIVSRLTDLSQDELGRLLAYERANRDRSTVSSRARSLQESEPFTGYDGLTGRDVAVRLRDSDEQTVTPPRVSTKGATGVASRCSRPPPTETGSASGPGFHF
jgi:hypothetical protein